MQKGRSFPERITITLPPSPEANQGREEGSTRDATPRAEAPLYVNLSQTQPALESHSPLILANQAPASPTLQPKALLEPVPEVAPEPARAAIAQAAPPNTEPPTFKTPEEEPPPQATRTTELISVPVPNNLTAVASAPERSSTETPARVEFNEPLALLPPTPSHTITAADSTGSDPLLERSSGPKSAPEAPTAIAAPEITAAASAESKSLQELSTEPRPLTKTPVAIAAVEITAAAAKVAPETSTQSATSAHAPARALAHEALETQTSETPIPAVPSAPIEPVLEKAPALPTADQPPTPAPSQTSRCVAVTGNPNCGKSTLFNALTGLRQKVGNYPGVTVEKKEGSFFGSHGEQMQLLDLPGCYSLQARSPDEAVARDVLLGRQPDTPRPDAVLAVLDATNLERNLYLLSQLLELGLPVFLGLNMLDLAEKQGIVVDPRVLSERLGIPVLPLVASEGVGLIALKQALSQNPLPLPKQRPPLPPALEHEARALAALLPSNGAEFAEALLLLGMPESQLDLTPYLTQAQKHAIEDARQRLVAAEVDPLSAAVDARYAWIGEIMAAAVRQEDGAALHLSDKLDRVLTHKFWGWLAFLGAMALVFFSIFTVAKIPADWISSGVGLLGDWLQTVMPEGDFRSLVIDGVLAGVSGVLVFLPQILILTFFLGLLEDTGYMARAAFLMDRLMSRVGLHGKSFIPMLSSFACAIPGIMATRTIEQRKDRLVTILVSPLMSCSARLPVYTLLISVLLPGVSVWKKSGIMLSMYVLGVLAAFLMAGIFKKTLLRSETPVLLMEMPPYRKPSMRGILMRMLERAGIFLKRAGTVILALSVLLWALTTYPKPENSDAKGSERIAHSVAGRLGKAIEPVIAPLGFDWKIGIGLIGSFAAREVFVSTMGIVYSIEKSGDDTPVTALSETMQKEKRADGSDVYTPLTGTALMVFYVLAMQCLSTLAVVRRETNSWRWPAFQLFYMTTLAYAGALLVFQGGRLLGFH